MAFFAPPAQAQPQFSAAAYNIEDNFGSPAEASIEIDADGGIESVLNAGNQGDIGRWDGNASLTKSDYEFRLDTISGTLNAPGSAAADTWISASASTDTWGIIQIGSGIKIFNGTLRVRPAGGGADIDTATVTLTADAT